MNGATVSSGKLTLDGIDNFVQFDENLIPSSGGSSVAFSARQLSPQAEHIEIISQGFSGGPGFYVGHDPSHNIRLGDAVGSTGIAYPSDGL